jgi:hypothetical protein
MKPSEYTIERDPIRGTYTTWWSDRDGFLCHMTFYLSTKAEVRADMREIQR